MGAGFVWTADKIAAKSVDEVRTVRENAAKLGHADIVALCDADLSRRNPPKIRKVSGRQSKGRKVLGFHFICPKDTGVTPTSDGRCWTGIWAVDERHATLAPAVGAYVALHVSKAAPSYLQGTVKDWRVKPRNVSPATGQKTKIEKGIEFLIEPGGEPLPWRGGGAGEKGYYYGEDELPPD